MLERLRIFLLLSLLLTVSLPLVFGFLAILGIVFSGMVVLALIFGAIEVLTGKGEILESFIEEIN